MLDHQQRVVDEATELHDKITKLSAFIDGRIYQSLDIANRYLLRSQLNAMRTYYEILQGRIALFPPAA